MQRFHIHVFRNWITSHLVSTGQLLANYNSQLINSRTFLQHFDSEEIVPRTGWPPFGRLEACQQSMQIFDNTRPALGFPLPFQRESIRVTFITLCMHALNTDRLPSLFLCQDIRPRVIRPTPSSPCIQCANIAGDMVLVSGDDFLTVNANTPSALTPPPLVETERSTKSSLPRHTPRMMSLQSTTISVPHRIFHWPVPDGKRPRGNPKGRKEETNVAISKLL